MGIDPPQPTSRWNTTGLILEGIAGTGKSTAIRSLLVSEAWIKKGHISSIVLSEHQTQRVLEANEKLGPLQVQDHQILLSKIVSMLEQFNSGLQAMDWSARNRQAHKLPFLLERFHFTHVFHYPGMTWEDVDDIDARLAVLNAKVCMLTINPVVMKQRIVWDTNKNGWQSFLQRFGKSDDEIIEHFIIQQEHLIRLTKLTRLPCRIIDTSNTPTQRVVEEMLDFWALT